MTSPQAEAELALADRISSVIGRLIRRLRDRSTIGDYSPSQKSVLRRLEADGPATLAALARAEDMRPQSMASIVGGLTEAGLVSGAKDPADGRQTILSLTATGSSSLAANRAARQDWLLAHLRDGLTADERAELSRGIDLLERLLEP